MKLDYLRFTRQPGVGLALLLLAWPWAPAQGESMPGMDHSSVPGTATGAMDHSQMPGMQAPTQGQSTPGVAPSTMPGHAMGAMDHSQMPGMQAPAPTRSRTPIPMLTDADRAAVYQGPSGHIHGPSLNTFLLVDQLEWQDADPGGSVAWEVEGWVGGDRDRLWLRSEGERTRGVTEHAELQALWGHAIGPWWDLVGGLRQDFKPGTPQTWAALGLQGMALYNFESQVTAYLGEDGQAALRLKGDYDLLLTQRLILQPSAEVNLYSRNDRQRGLGAGLADSEIGLRLRYEIRREFAPYIGVTWNRSYGRSADYARDEAELDNDPRLVLGLRLWF
ncbi:copper resistance protein B [Pseudomonas protegens]|uniref:copper resistance protein B n=1 Tax=Pseudomonas protegens TaxID=380021 RepID=UPI00223FC6DF|nr:copper resistance protein B [Pseudomonas protegens]QEN47964.1 copper resistance protein CopB [Pseudomonas protegens]